MYLPEAFEETDVATLHALMRTHPLGAWVMHDEDGLTANHIPFQLDATRGPFGTLIGHVARANPVWRKLCGDTDALVIFQGPESYVTPSWYPAKQVHGKVVPTWNYAVVHAHGRPQVFEDRERMLQHLQTLTDTHETGRAQAWKIDDAPPAFIERLLEAIVGVEIQIGRLVGKWKVSQNRPETDRDGVVAGLVTQGDERARAMAGLVRERLPRSGKA